MWQVCCYIDSFVLIVSDIRSGKYIHVTTISISDIVLNLNQIKREENK